MCLRSFALPAAVLALLNVAASAQNSPPTPEDTPASSALDSLDEQLPGITVHRDKQRVDLDATVVLQEGDWLELLACSPKSREHESILTVDARPSHIHLALILAGFEAGSPVQVERTDDGFITHPPRGDKLSAFIVYENEDGETVETPATDWIRHQPTGEAMAHNVWLFTGSAFREVEGHPTYYMADLNGTIVSLVNFGDDLVTRPTQVTNASDAQRWNTFASRIPEPGTKVTLSLRAYEGDADLSELIDGKQEATEGPPAPPISHSPGEASPEPAE